jgi:DNA-binding NtrC family response regulator
MPSPHSHVAPPRDASAPPLPTLDLGELERLAIAQALDETNGNRVHAARLLHIHVRTLHRKLSAQRSPALVLVKDGA